MIQQLVDLGAPPDVIEAARKKRAPLKDDGCLEVWPENWPALQTFQQLGTQWNVVAGMAGIVHIGLIYAEVEPAMRRARVPRRDWPDCWESIRIMERAALPLLNRALS